MLDDLRVRNAVRKDPFGLARSTSALCFLNGSANPFARRNAGNNGQCDASFRVSAFENYRSQPHQESQSPYRAMMNRAAKTRRLVRGSRSETQFVHRWTVSNRRSENGQRVPGDEENSNDLGEQFRTILHLAKCSSVRTRALIPLVST